MPKKIKLNGPVIGDGNTWIYDWFGIPYISASKVSKELEDARGDDVELYINSGGGSVFAGSEVYTILKEYQGNVKAKITGVAASAASFLAMAANELLMSPPAQMMIHNAAVGTEGDKNIHTSNTGMLQGTDVGITNAYRLKTGKNKDELLDLMNKTTWMNAQQAVEYGFADGILFDEDNTLVEITNSLSGEISPQIIDKLRDILINTMIKGPVAANSTEMDSNLFQGMDLTSLLKQGGIMNQLPALLDVDGGPENIIPLASIDTQQTKEESKTMNYEELKNQHPELFNQVMDEGVKNERARINALNNLSKAPGAAEIVAKAIEDGRTAAEAAIDIVNASTARIDDQAKNRQNDADLSNVAKVVTEEPTDKAAQAKADDDAAVNTMTAELERLNKKGGNR